MSSFLITLVLLAIALATGRFLYEVKFPQPGTRPSFLRVLLVAPVSIVFAFCGVFGLVGLMGLLGG